MHDQKNIKIQWCVYFITPKFLGRWTVFWEPDR